MITKDGYEHKARKRFGQNFLVDQVAIRDIVHHIAPQKDDFIIEIGPGLGAITENIYSINPSMLAVEIDRDLAAILKQKFPKLFLLEEDALQVNYNDLIKQRNGKNVKVVGNLPYNISTPLIFYLASFGNLIDEMYFMLQKDLVERMISPPGCKSYGKLSVMIQSRFEVSSLFDLSPSAFSPQPKIYSSFISIKPRKESLAIDNPSTFERVVSLAFQQRRKTLRNSLKQLQFLEGVEKCGGLLNLRPEQLSIDEFIFLSDNIIGAP